LGDFQRGAARVVARQEVGQAQRIAVHGTAGWHAEVLVAEAAEVLEGGQQSGFEDGDGHCCMARSSSRRFTSIGTKRTKSPGASTAGGSRAGSKSRKGVTPMIRQPPGRRCG